MAADPQVGLQMMVTGAPPVKLLGAGSYTLAKGYQGLSKISQFLSRAKVADSAIDILPKGQSLMLRPVEIEFPAYGLSSQKQALFAAHLNEQQIGLNYLSLQRTDDLLTNLTNYPNIASELKAARALGRFNIEGSGAGLTRLIVLMQSLGDIYMILLASAIRFSSVLGLCGEPGLTKSFRAENTC